MKRVLFFLFATFWISAAVAQEQDVADITPVYSETAYKNVLGEWELSPSIILKDDGLLVEPSAVYSFPYIGITEINFIDKEFLVFTINGVEYRAFFDIQELDFDNLHIDCLFKDGEEFKLKLVKLSSDRWKYFYVIPEDSILGVDSTSDKVESVDVSEDSVTESEAEPLESVYTGIMIRQE